MFISDDGARRALKSFMAARCDVSSQHKLPGEADILSTYTAACIGRDRTRDLIQEMVQKGELIVYGPYLSDHAIDVM